MQETRIQQYQNYVNLRDIFEQNHEKLKQESVSVSKVLLLGLLFCFLAVRCCLPAWLCIPPQVSLLGIVDTLRCDHKLGHLHLQKGCRFYDFYQNLQNVRSDIAHFQVQPHPPLPVVNIVWPILRLLGWDKQHSPPVTYTEGCLIICLVGVYKCAVEAFIVGDIQA